MLSLANPMTESKARHLLFPLKISEGKKYTYKNVITSLSEVVYIYIVEAIMFIHPKLSSIMICVGAVSISAFFSLN